MITTLDPKLSLRLQGIGLVVTGPVGGVWTVIPPNTMSQATLDSLILIASTEVSEAANTNALLDKAKLAIAKNNDFLALLAPTNLQVVTQVVSLTRQQNALLKLLTKTLNDTSGT